MTDNISIARKKTTRGVLIKLLYDNQSAALTAQTMEYALMQDNPYISSEILDVYYTDAPMEVTEIGAADILHRNHVAIAAIESNNGGRIFARNVGERLWQRHHDRSVYILPRNQRQNKEARILTQSSYVEQNVFFPSGWERRWPDAYRALSGYQRKGKNAHDDAPDALTGLCECAQGKISTRTKRVNGKGAYK